MIKGDNGILTQTEKAKVEHLKAQDKEQLELIVTGVVVENKGKRPFAEVYKEFVEALQNGKTIAEILYPKLDKNEVAKLAKTVYSDVENVKIANNEYQQILEQIKNYSQDDERAFIAVRTINGYYALYDTDGKIKILDDYEKGFTVTYWVPNENGDSWVKLDTEEKTGIKLGSKIDIIDDRESITINGKEARFIGWSKKEEDKQPPYGKNKTNTVVIKNNTNLYAQFEHDQYSLTINHYVETDNNYILSTTDSTLITKGAGVDLSTYAKDDLLDKYEFQYSSLTCSESGGDEIVGNKLIIYRDQIVVALYYNLKEYDVTFSYKDSTGRDITTIPQKVKHGGTAIPPEITELEYTTDNIRYYKFANWDNYTNITNDTNVNANYRVSKTYLYKAGDQCTSITGGWVKLGGLYNDGHHEFRSDYLYLKREHDLNGDSSYFLRTANKIKYEGEKFLHVEIKEVTGIFNFLATASTNITSADDVYDNRVGYEDKYRYIIKETINDKTKINRYSQSLSCLSAGEFYSWVIAGTNTWNGTEVAYIYNIWIGDEEERE